MKLLNNPKLLNGQKLLNNKKLLKVCLSYKTFCVFIYVRAFGFAFMYRVFVRACVCVSGWGFAFPVLRFCDCGFAFAVLHLRFCVCGFSFAILRLRFCVCVLSLCLCQWFCVCELGLRFWKVQPHFEYCSAVWGNCNITLADKFQKLQNRAARVLTFWSYDTNADRLFEELGWVKLETQRQIHKVVMVYKSMNGLAPDYLRMKFVDRGCVSNYSLRDTVGKLAVPFPRTNYLKNSFGYSGVGAWNSLPVDLRQTNSLNAFRSGCSKFFS